MSLNRDNDNHVDCAGDEEMLKYLQKYFSSIVIVLSILDRVS